MIKKVLIFQIFLSCMKRGSIRIWGGDGGEKWYNKLEDKTLLV